nr:CTTNBP2 N-terminal-like protein [Zootoca vivipara]XP_034978911.1 CTTNBP2 N-terminal-like protein [Zootoca vivipara]XP_034978912.1 CTTNBP2 N-terminal-like protein [Zootoca vivipara]XP_034978913.1 CTTNBP2 N-terminal-like protein [Zootoca vivipara]
MNLDKLSKPELLTLFSILEGELEAQDVVIEALKARRRDTFIEERYGQYNISNPFTALQRDFEALNEENRGDKQPVCTNPLTILKGVMKHCKNMQEKMLFQLAAAESRHRKVILDLEEERRRHAQDTAEGDDVTYMLEKERERLAQQLEFEKSQAKKFEKEQKKLLGQLEEEHDRQQQLSAMLVLECKKATAKAAEEGQKLGELRLKLAEERSKVSHLEGELAAQKKRGLQMEARVEKQLSEFDTEREQLRAKLDREENLTKALKEEVENLKTTLKELEASYKAGRGKAEHTPPKVSKVSTATATEGSSRSVTCQTESPWTESLSQGSTIRRAPMSSPISATASHSYTKANGHCDAHVQASMEPALPKDEPIGPAAERATEMSSSPARTVSISPSTPPVPSSGIFFSPSNTASSSLTPSPCSSPVMTKSLVGASVSSPSYQSPYQVGINQRFHAARHKFQSQSDQDHQPSGLQSPPSRDLSPTLVDNSAAKQIARNTVTQVLSRFTSQQGPIKPVSPNSSPFGTDYRSLATPLSPKSERGPGKVSGPLSPLSPGIKSPTIPRGERGNPPPIPPKKPGLVPSPASPTPPTKTSSQASSLGSPMDLASSCCSSNPVIANGKEIEILLPTSS